MASIVIVTKQCYLLAESINYIAINEVDEDSEKISLFSKPKKGKKLTKAQKEKMDLTQFQIVIDFVPAQGNNSASSNRNGTASVAVRVTGRQRCLDLFAHMVKQIREQMPDNKFLDEIVESFLRETGTNG